MTPANAAIALPQPDVAAEPSRALLVDVGGSAEAPELEGARAELAAASADYEVALDAAVAAVTVETIHAAFDRADACQNRVLATVRRLRALERRPPLAVVASDGDSAESRDGAH